jgi:uncharacterized membrane protein YeiB
MNRKGLFYWIELILLIIVLIMIVLSFPRSRDGFLANKDSLDMEKLGFSALQSLDNANIIEAYANTTNFTGSNFTALSVYIKSSLPSTVAANIEYFNGTNCTSEFGVALTSCGNVTRTKDTAVAEYTYAKLSNPVTIKLYLRRILG